MTPNDIEVILHFYCCPAPHPRIDAPAVESSIRQFIAAGLLEANPKSNSGYTVTDGGKMLIDAICDIPFPVRQWVMPSPAQRQAPNPEVSGPPSGGSAAPRC